MLFNHASVSEAAGLLCAEEDAERVLLVWSMEVVPVPGARRLKTSKALESMWSNLYSSAASPIVLKVLGCVSADVGRPADFQDLMDASSLKIKFLSKCNIKEKSQIT